MKTKRLRAMGTTIGVLVAAAVAFGQQPPPAASAGQAAKSAERPTPAHTFSGPVTHRNLTIFLIHGKGTLPGKEFLTLQEALDQKKIVVHETQTVNQLSVENVALDVEVFIQAGDIVKGGKQDRVLAYDLVVPSKSGKMPLASFCVEAGRWRQRGKEDASRFQSSSGQVSGKDLKLAVTYARKQDQVWAKVKEAQMKLSKNVGKSVENKESPSSLQLTLEDKRLLDALDEYEKALAKALQGKDDVLGFAAAINGQVEGADVYGSPVLFRKLWPKLLKSCAIDALAEWDKDKKFEPAKVEQVKAFLADVAQGKKSIKDVSNRVQICTQESAKSVLMECSDKAKKDAVIHRSYLAK
jgi:hypothetical protein